MPTRNVVLTPNQAEFIEQMVASGRYQNASEVLREGLRLLWQREEERLARQQLRDQVVSVESVTALDTDTLSQPLSLDLSR